MSNPRHIRKSTLAFVAIAFTYLVVFCLLSFARVDTLKTYMNDAGNMDQAVWGSLHGHFLHQSNTIVGQQLTRFYAHFDPVLLLFVPFYAMLPTLKWLLLFQTLAIVLGAVPIFTWCRKKLGPTPALLLSLVYFLNPMLQNANLYDMHPCVLAVPVLSFMIWAILEEKMVLFWSLAGVLLCIKEEMSLLLICLGLVLLQRRKYKQGTTAVILGASVFVLVMKLIIPAFSPYKAHMFLASHSSTYGPGFSARFGCLGASIPEILQTIFFRPGYFLSHLLTPDRLVYVFWILFPMLFLPLFSVVACVALPSLFINLFDTTHMMHNFYFYHSAVLVPIILWATLEVLVKVKGYRPRFVGPLLLGMVAISLTFNLLFGVMPYSRAPLKYAMSDFIKRPHDLGVRKLQLMVPPSASISVQQNLGIFFSQRLGCYRFPMQAGTTDYVLVDFSNPYHSEAADALYDYLLLYPRKQILSDLFRLTDSGAYGVLYQEDGYVLLQKGFINAASHQQIERQSREKGFLYVQ